jgi:hypothetical protein
MVGGGVGNAAPPVGSEVCAATLSSPELYAALDGLAVRDNTQAVTTTQFIAAGQTASVVLLHPYDSDATYRVLLQRDPRDNKVGSLATSALLAGGLVSAQPISSTDPQVQSGVVPAASTVLYVRIPVQFGDLWSPAVLYAFACKGGMPQLVARLSQPLSPRGISLGIAIAFVALGYALTAIAVGIVGEQKKGSRLSFSRWIRYLDPVKLAAGADGKGNASKLQILFFSCVVVGLLAFIIMRTGILSNLSGTILTLLGISAVGAAASKATDATKNRLDFENWAWLIEKNWLPPNGLTAINTARWRDVVTTDGEFDVYRFQMLLFSIVVGGALLTSPWQDLASFSIPDNLLGVLGLSQVVYVGGKLVAPPSMADLDKALTELRQLESEFRNAAITRPDPLNVSDRGRHLRRLRRPRDLSRADAVVRTLPCTPRPAASRALHPRGSGWPVILKHDSWHLPQSTMRMLRRGFEVVAQRLDHLERSREMSAPDSGLDARFSGTSLALLCDPPADYGRSRVSMRRRTRRSDLQPLQERRTQ